MVHYLYSIPGSGFSERVVWAANLGGLRLAIIPYDPFGFGELLVRWKTGTYSGRITAPALLTKHGVNCDSLEVAYLFDQQSSKKLFPPGSADEIRRWHEAANLLLAQGRACFFQNARFPATQQVLCPAPLRALGWLGQLLNSLIVRMALVRLTWKFSRATAATSLDKCKEVLDAARAALQGGKHSYLVGDSLTFADLSFACGLNMLAVDANLPANSMDPNVMKHFQLPQTFARDYADLLEWRAQLLKRHPYKGQ